ncbi:MAG: Mur ligase, partial [Kluyvera intermedia]
MSVDHLLAHIRAQVEKLNVPAQPSPFPGFILFLSASNAQERAYTAYACGDTLDEAWQRAQDDLQRWASQQSRQPVWLRVDLVDKIQTLRWDALQEKLGKT